VGVQKVRWSQVGTEPAEDYTIFSRILDTNRKLGTGLLVRKGIISAVKIVEFVSSRMLTGRLCDIIFTNEHVAGIADKSNMCRIFVGKPERKRPLNYEGDNIKMNFK
jgi:hypothetical protein